MSGETEKDVSAWTIDSLRYHLEQLAADLDRRHEQRFEAQEKAVDAALVAQEKAVAAALAAAEKAVSAALAAQKEAVAKSEASIDRRLENVNEFRAQLSDQARTFLPRAEAEVRVNALEKEVAALASRMDLTQGRSAGIGVSAGVLAATIGAGVALLTAVVIIANLLTG